MRARRNPDLPILDELEARYEALVEDEVRGEGRRDGGTGPRRAKRVARRVGTMLVLVCMVGSVAVAARIGGDREKPPASTQPALLGSGGGGAWKLYGYRHEGRLCVMLTIAGDLASDCGEASSSRGVRAASLIGGSERLIFGISRSEVVQVAIRIGEWRGSGPTRQLENPGAAEVAGVPPGARWFALAFSRSDLAGKTSAPARIVGFGTSGRALGVGSLDCSLGAVGPNCKRLIRTKTRLALQGK